MEDVLFCRLCALKKDRLVGIYDDEGHKLNIETKINKCLQIEIYQTDSLPKCVCLECCFKLDQFSIFMDSSVSAQATLHRLFQDDNLKGDINDTTQAQLELTSLDCANTYQVVKEFSTNEQIEEQVHLHQVQHEDEVGVNGNDGCDTDVFGDVVDDVDEEEDEDEFDDEVHDFVHNNDNCHHPEDVLNNDENNPVGYVECFVPEKDDDNSSKRKRSIPMKCFNNSSMSRVKRKINLKRKLLQNEEHQQEQVICNSDPNKLVNSNNDIVVHEQQREQHNGVIEYNSDCKNEEFSEFKDDNENNEPNSKNVNANRGEWEHLTSWVCCDCTEELPNVEALREHHNVVHKQPPRYMCSQCTKVYTQFHCFNTHIKRHRNLVKYSCEECGKCFSNRKVLDMHLATHSDNRPYICTVCGKGFRQQSALYIHGRCHLPEEIKNKFACDECDKRFSTKPNLVTHKRIHTGVRNFTCDQCGKSFIQKGNLDAHLITHSQDKPFNCDLCNKGFKTSMQLRKHHTVHTGAKPHQCDVCGRTFRERGTLREHHRIHTGAMPFTCEFCGKAFRFKGILTTHRRQHTGERPYSCLECQHHFTNWPNYNKHMKRRHGINTSRTTRVKTTPPPMIPPTTTTEGPITADAPPLYEDSISAPPEDLSDRSQTNNHQFYPPAINVAMTTPMTATYHMTPHANTMLSFYNLTQIQTLDPNAGAVSTVNIGTPIDVIHAIPQQIVHH
ncbi:uncharacterized protein LOC142333045 [Lycorma delicatula]|uniref:uncharacterized protein LOC142333045 n=1 Tax=Lycorma delicatula TaxID=130591 RepID=UPI003F518DC7